MKNIVSKISKVLLGSALAVSIFSCSKNIQTYSYNATPSAVKIADEVKSEKVQESFVKKGEYTKSVDPTVLGTSEEIVRTEAKEVKTTATQKIAQKVVTNKLNKLMNNPSKLEKLQKAVVAESEGEGKATMKLGIIVWLIGLVIGLILGALGYIVATVGAIIFLVGLLQYLGVF
jgi:hypothetical protein